MKENKSITKSMWMLLIALMSVVFLGAVDISIVSPALKNISRALNAPISKTSWIITIYTLIYVLAVPLMSAVSDKWGRKKTIIVNIILFALGSLVAVFSTNLIHLLIARGIQALGAGGLFPIASTVIGEKFPKAKRGMALGFIGMTWGVAGIIGPLLGGWLTQWLGWTSIFYAGFFLSFISLFLALKYVPSGKPIHSNPFDYKGMIFFGAGLIVLTYALIKLNSGNFISSLLSFKELSLFTLAAIFFIVLYFIEKKTEFPIVHTKLFSNSQLNIAYILSFARGITEVGIVFIPAYAMSALGINAGLAGTILLASAITLFLFTEPAGILVDKIGPKKVLLFGAVMLVISGFLMVSARTMSQFIIYQIIMGLGLSALSGAPIRYLVLHHTSDKERSSAQGLISLFSSFGVLFGSALASSFLAEKSGTLAGFHYIYLTLAIVSIISGIAILFIKDTKTV